MTTISTDNATTLTTLSTSDLSTVVGGTTDPGTCTPKIFTAEEADAKKRELDLAYGFDLSDPGRAVCRTVPGHPGQFTVQTPRLDGHGTRNTLNGG
jgi:hypothetical protein